MASSPDLRNTTGAPHSVKPPRWYAEVVQKTPSKTLPAKRQIVQSWWQARGMQYNKTITRNDIVREKSHCVMHHHCRVQFAFGAQRRVI